MSTTNIEWTDASWNPLAGCSMCSPGCAKCYAETMAKRLKAMAERDVAAGKDPGRKRHYLNVIGSNGKWNGHIALIPEALDEPLRRKKPTTWFVNSMSDLFHELVPFEFVDRVFAVMALCPHHTFQVLTKRPERMAEYFDRFIEPEFDGQTSGPNPVGRYSAAYMTSRHYKVMNQIGEIAWDAFPVETSRTKAHDALDRASRTFPLPNVWLGTSCEDQKRADERIPHLLRCPAAIRFLSCEPLLGEIDLRLGDIVTVAGESGYRRDFINWVIVGGESGPGARPCDIAWVRSIVRQCREAGVPCFVKQMGAHVLFDGVQGGYLDGPSNCWPAGTKKDPLGQRWRMLLNDKKGGEMEEWPEDLRIRQMPNERETVTA